jgi:molybdopterin converting factor subunit 1
MMAGMRILFFAQLREVCGVAEADLAADGMEAAALWEVLVARWPGLAAQQGNVRLARNGVYAGEGEIFAEGDEVALIPPVSGG